MAGEFPDLIDYFLELDGLKLVNRRSYVGGGVRLENSAEHSWHLAMACWALARHFKVQLSEEKLLKLALIHDLGEVDAGDTFLYSRARATADRAERECIRRFRNHPGNPVAELMELWEEQETGASTETKLLKATDRLLPFMLNVASEGKAWREHGVKRSQVEAAHGFIAKDFPEIYSWVTGHIKQAVENGWLVDA